MGNMDDLKTQRLHKQGVFNKDAEAVSDPLFDGSSFFDPRDLVLVKYEMLRRVRVEGMSAMAAAKQFGFSRSGFYKTLAAFRQGGLVGLIPARPGPRHAHKLTEDILEFIDHHVAARGKVSATQLAALLREDRNVDVHPRSIERALERRKKRGKGT